MLFRTDDPARWGTGKGANLTPGEVDGNFWDLLSRVVTLETDESAPNGIANIAVTGSQMTVFLDDGTALGPYTLPTAMIRYRGDWVAAAAYAELDLVAVPDAGIYLVLRDHTAGAAFDASATDASGNQLYRWLFTMSGRALDDLSDVSSAAPADGEVLGYDVAAAAWTPRAPGIADAPADGGTYGRLDGAWSVIDTVVNWADIPDKPVTFPSDAHTHDAADIASGSLAEARLPAIAWTANNDGAGSGLDADLLDGVQPSPFILGLLDDADAATARSTLDAPSLSGKNTFPDTQTIDGRLMALGGGYLRDGFFAMPGQGAADFGMTGFYDRNELTLADLRGTVTLGGTGPMSAANLGAMFDGTGSHGTISGTDATTTRIEIVVELPANLALQGSANWQPFLQYRLSTGGSITWYNSVTVEVSPDGVSWNRPAGGAWETTDFHNEGQGVTGVPGLWVGANASPPDNAVKFVRFILEDRREDAGYASKASVWVAEVGLRHMSASYARQLLRTDGGEFYGGYWAKGATGGDQGAGTINATALYDDGTLLCAPIEEVVTGGYDPATWRALAPNGGLDRHEAMKARGFRPGSADSYADEIEAGQGVPGYWNRAEWKGRIARRRTVQETDPETGELVPTEVEDRVSLAERHERALLALDYAALAIRDLTRRVQALENAGNG